MLEERPDLVTLGLTDLNDDNDNEDFLGKSPSARGSLAWMLDFHAYGLGLGNEQLRRTETCKRDGA